jgi:fumarylacetoacetase
VESNLKYLYWSFAQQLAHHTINGCNMRTGDICGSGTISGAEKSAWGSILELTWNGKEPLTIGDKEVRTFLEDDDVIRIEGFAGENDEIYFGSCEGQILKAD